MVRMPFGGIFSMVRELSIKPFVQRGDISRIRGLVGQLSTTLDVPIGYGDLSSFGTF